MILLLALLMFLTPVEAIADPIITPIVREVETPARFFEHEIEDNWYAIFWSDEITKPITGIRVSLPEGETIKISTWNGEYPDGDETILYKGISGDITIEGFIVCDQVAIYSTGNIDELKVSVCYVDTKSV